MAEIKRSKKNVLWISFLIFLLSATLVPMFMALISRAHGIHDVAVTKITLLYNTTVVFPTWESPLNITVTVKNNGTKLEAFNVTAYYYNNTRWNLIQTQTITLSKETEENVTFTWDCRNLSGYSDNPDLAWHYPVYEIKANATLVDDANPDDNELIDGNVTVQWPGDCDGDGYVNDVDYEIFSDAWGSQYPDSKYDPRADFDGSGDVYTTDLGLLSDWWHKGPLDFIDAAVTNIAFSYDTTVVYTNCSFQIYVTVKNNGTETETFNVAVYANSTEIDTKNVTLTGGNSTTITFTWNIPNATWPYLNYTLNATATLLDDENPANNELPDGTVTVRWPGDCNGDGHVDTTDLLSPYFRDDLDVYNPRSDFNGDGLVDIEDVKILIDHWETGPLDS